MSRSRGARAAAVAIAALVCWTGSASGAEPTMRVSASTTAVGHTIVVTLTGWPTTATVAVCGNEARRGAVDCDQIGAVGVPESTQGAQQRPVVVAAPPAPCPCVVRAATAGETLVRVVPITIAGMPSAPTVARESGGSALEVTARVVATSHSFAARLQSSLGGPTRRTLVLTLANRGPTPLSGVTVTAAVARDAQGGEPLQPPNVDTLAPGQSRRLRIPLRLAPPSYGSYVVFGSVYGGGAAVSFAARTTTMPWALILLLAVLLGDLLLLVVARARRRRGTRTDIAPSVQLPFA